MDILQRVYYWAFKIEGDRSLRYAFTTLICISIVFIFTSTTVFAYQTKGGNLSYYPFRHIGFLCVAWICAAITSKVSPKIFNRFALFICIIGLCLGAITPLCGESLNGATRWLKIGFIQFQPSEISKIALIFFVAKVLSIHKKEPAKAFAPIVIATILAIAPILTENLSTVVLIVTTVTFLMIIGSIPIKKILTLGLSVLLIAAAYLYFVPEEYQMQRIKTWKARIERFIPGEDLSEDTGKNFQAEQARLAVAHSGLLGTGVGMSYVKNFLPMAYSDFIYSTILEECGAWGGIIVIALYLWLLVRAIRISQRCDSAFEIYLILGLTIVLCLQAFINMAVGVGLIPVTGQTLPLISMGGTSNVIVGGVLGVVFSVSAHLKPREVKVDASKEMKETTASTEFVSDDITPEEEDEVILSESRDN